MSRAVRVAAAVAVGCVVLSLAAPSPAQTSAAPSPPAAPPSSEEARRAEAESLFEQGKALLAKDDWDAACALFEASAQVAEAAPALVKVARCDARAGRLAQAIEVHERALLLHPWPELDRLVRAELFEIQRRAPSIRVTLVAPASGVRLRRNGRALPPEALHAALWTDVGAEEHFLAEAPGYRSATFDLVAGAEGEILELRVALTADAPPPPPSPPPPDPRRPVGWSFAGAGALALAAGAGFGVEFLVRRAGVFAGCSATLADGRHVCPSSTSARYDDAVSARTRAAVLLGAGAALGAVGAALLIASSRRAGAPSATLAVGPGTIDLGGAF